jgi:O-antigen/teichoic acid export membrane protein
MMIKIPPVSTFGKVLIDFASAQVISNVLKVLAGFLVVRILDPEVYGIYTGIGVYLGYFALGHVGVINGLGREFPYQLGKKNNEYGIQLANSAYAVTTIISLLSGVVFLGLSVYHFISRNNLLGVIFLSYVVVACLNLFINQFLPTLYRTNSDFNKLSKINLTFGYWNLLSVLLVWKLGFSGLLIRGIALSVIQFYLLFKNKPYHLHLKPIKQDVIHLFKTGLPIFMVGQVNPLWSTIVNNMIFALGGAQYFGLYALANVVQSTVQIIPLSFGQVIYPRMAIMYGEGRLPQEIIRLNLKPLIFQFFVMLVIAGFGILILPEIVPWLLPKYVNGIRAAQWIMLLPVIYSFGAIDNIFNVTGKQRPYFISLVMGALIGTFYMYFQLSHFSFNLLVFPQGMILGALVQQILSLVFAFRLK